MIHVLVFAPGKNEFVLGSDLGPALRRLADGVRLATETTGEADAKTTQASDCSCLVELLHDV